MVDKFLKALTLLLFCVSMAFSETVTLAWDRPVERVNGDPLSFEEIGGYEVRGNCNNRGWVHFILPPEALEYTLDPDVFYGMCDVQVAVFDTNGLYSEFVSPVNNPFLIKLDKPKTGGFR